MYHSHRAGPVLQEFGFVLRVGVRTPAPALGLRVVVSLVKDIVDRR